MHNQVIDNYQYFYHPCDVEYDKVWFLCRSRSKLEKIDLANRFLREHRMSKNIKPLDQLGMQDVALVGGKIATYHALNTGGQRYLGVIEALVYPIGDSPVVKQ